MSIGRTDRGRTAPGPAFQSAGAGTFAGESSPLQWHPGHAKEITPGRRQGQHRAEKAALQFRWFKSGHSIRFRYCRGNLCSLPLYLNHLNWNAALRWVASSPKTSDRWSGITDKFTLTCLGRAGPSSRSPHPRPLSLGERGECLLGASVHRPKSPSPRGRGVRGADFRGKECVALL